LGNELITRPGGELVLGGVTFTATGATVEDGVSFEEWEQAVAFARRAESGVAWWIGDLLNDGEKTYGETYAQAMDATGLEYQTVKIAKWVAGNIEKVRRRTNLSFEHHREVASLEPDEQDQWLDRASAEGWNRSELWKEIKEERRRAALTAAGNFPGAEYRVILADPPWEYADERTGTVQAGAASAHYPTLPTPAICELADPSGRTVRELSAADAVLFLWATVPCMKDALAVMEAWGFTYKTYVVWDKVRGYNGHYFDVVHESLLVGLRGSFPPADGPLEKSIVREEKGRHSQKPERFYELIEAMYPAGPRLELFARRRRDGWERWGNEAGEPQAGEPPPAKSGPVTP
jgi:N6-adenosine-specific RNA methylase IME4